MSSREVFKEFEFLLEKSQRSFNRLRDLPPYGNSRWEHHFHKAFHIYSKLWKFQQDNRCARSPPARLGVGVCLRGMRPRREAGGRNQCISWSICEVWMLPAV